MDRSCHLDQLLDAGKDLLGEFFISTIGFLLVLGLLLLHGLDACQHIAELWAQLLAPAPLELWGFHVVVT